MCGKSPRAVYPRVVGINMIETSTAL
jgi:hypothetical protein